MAVINLGRVAPFPRGQYSALTEYNYFDLVTDNGSSYLYINKSPSTGDPLSSTTHWQQIASSAANTYRPEICAVDFGADPTGISDSGAAINAAINYAYANSKGSVYIPAGTYIIETPVAPKSNVRIFGDGISTVLKIKTGMDINCIQPSSGVYFICIESLLIDGNKSANSYTNGGNAINIWMDSSLIRHVYTQNISKSSLLLNWDGAINGDILGHLNRVEHNEFRDADEEGIRWGWRTTDSWCCFNNIGSGKANLLLQGGSCRFIGNHLNGNPEYNVYAPDGVNVMMFSQNIMENAKKHGFYFPRPGYRTAAVGVSIVDNIIRACGTDATDTYDLIHMEGYDADTRMQDIQIVGNRLINTNATLPRYPVYLKFGDNVQVKSNIRSNYSEAAYLYTEDILDGDMESDTYDALVARVSALELFHT